VSFDIAYEVTLNVFLLFYYERLTIVSFQHICDWNEIDRKYIFNIFWRKLQDSSFHEFVKMLQAKRVLLSLVLRYMKQSLEKSVSWLTRQI